jgi:hypothetical protein
MPLNYFNQFSTFLHGINVYLSLLSVPQYYALLALAVALCTLAGFLLVRSGLVDSAVLNMVEFFRNLSGRFQSLRDKFARHEEATEEKPEEPILAAPSEIIHVPAGRRSIESLSLEFYILAKKEFGETESVPTLENAIAHLAAKQSQVLSDDVLSVEHF